MAITWSGRPRRDDEPRNFQLVRTPRSGTIRGIILNPGLTGTGTHYYGGRTVPCLGSKCKACEDGASPRWYGYLPIWNSSNDRIAIAEVPDAAADEIDRYHARHNTLRGSILTLRRQGSRPNGRVVADVVPGSIDQSRLPSAVDVQQCLEKIWGINRFAQVTGSMAKEREANLRKNANKQSTNGTH